MFLNLWSVFAPATLYNYNITRWGSCLLYNRFIEHRMKTIQFTGERGKKIALYVCTTPYPPSKTFCHCSSYHLNSENECEVSWQSYPPIFRISPPSQILKLKEGHFISRFPNPGRHSRAINRTSIPHNTSSTPYLGVRPATPQFRGLLFQKNCNCPCK